MDLEHITTLLLDGDGVLYKQDTPQPGLTDFFHLLNERGINWSLMTNNATKNVAEYVEKLRRYGVEASAEQIFSSATVTAEHLAETYPQGTHIYVIGTASLQGMIREAGFTVHSGDKQPEADIAAVVTALDIDITYRKLTVATRLIRYGGADFIGTNPDRTFPTPNGLAPGAGMLIAGLEAATDREATIIGKPHTPIFQAAMELHGATPEETAVIGDRLETDILGGRDMGITTVLLLSGVTTQKDLETHSYQPDYVFDELQDLLEVL